jgi:ATP-dependent Clp protease protease subunit
MTQFSPKKVTAIEQLISDVHGHNINHHSRELYLHGHIDVYEEEEPGVDYRMATMFIKNLHILEAQNNQNILVHMHTIGGSWSDGMAIYNSLRLCSSSITIMAYAEASSMSGIVLQAADKRILMPDCELMIHHGSISVEDNTMAAKSAIDQNEKNCKRMLEIFAQRAVNGKYFTDRKYSLRKIMNFIDGKIKQTSDWYLTSEEAVYYGFADGIYGGKGFESMNKIRSGRKKKDIK